MLCYAMLCYAQLRENGVIGDAREPDVLRVSPVPLYNSFDDVFRAVRRQ